MDIKQKNAVSKLLIKIQELFRWLTFHALDKFAYLPVKSFDKPEIKDRNRILIIELAQIGDIILSSLIFRRLKVEYPQSNILFLTTPWVQEVVRFNPYIDEIYYYPAFWEDRSIE